VNEIKLQRSEAASAQAIQRAIDALVPAGGRVVLPAMELELDRGIELRSGVTLAGQGRDTVLRKAPGCVYPFSGYHNYGMCDIPLMHTEGLVPGMTVAVRDTRHGGFYETFARITWVDDNWVGIDKGIHSDYHAELNPVLVTAFPLIYGENVRGVAVEDLTLDGNREAQPAGIGACRGAGVYFIAGHDVAVTNVVETGFSGEGIGFQLSRDVHLEDCVVTDNAGNGYHPGAGSTGVAFINCVAESNDMAGFFFCVRANHITVRDCRFAANRGPGISVGTRDSFNLIESCEVSHNEGAGILFRACPRPVEPESVWVRNCRVAANGRGGAQGQVVVLGDAHDLAFEGNTIVGAQGLDLPALYAAPSAQRVWLSNNEMTGCSPAIVSDSGALIAENPVAEAGVEAVEDRHYRHLVAVQAAAARC